jgi:hypothetical protein
MRFFRNSADGGDVIGIAQVESWTNMQTSY